MSNKETKSPKTYKEVTVLDEPTICTGHSVLDNLLSRKAGFVIGSSIFLTGTSGAGKTTLIATLQKMLENYKSSFYSREMASSDVKEQTDNLNINHDNAYISDVEDYENLEEYIKMLDILKPKFVMVDSLQVIVKEDYYELGEDKGEFEVIQTLRKWVKKNDAVLIVIGHVTKGGQFRGNNTIMQMFDAHFEMIHDKKKDFRTFSVGNKNRKGGSSDVVYYEFGETGLVFYTKEQWEVRKENKSLDDFIFEGIRNFFDGLDTTHPNYPEFKKEFNSEWTKRVDGSQGGKTEVVKIYLDLTNEMLNKHNII